MEDNKLRKILLELYTFEPSLKEKEAILIPLINKLDGFKPDTKFDAAFAARLKAEIMKMTVAPSTSTTNKKNNNSFNFNFMDKKLYFALGSLAVASLVFIFFMKTSLPGSETHILNTNSLGDSASVSVLPAGAFGSLASLGTATADGVTGKTTALGMGGGGGIANTEMMAAVPAADARDNASSATIMPVATTDMKIMPPYYGFKYVYKGEALDLTDTSAPVYRRLKGDSSTAKSMAGLIGSFDFAGINVASFSNLKVNNLSLMEDKDLGLVLYFDFNEDNVNVYENWEKWTLPQRDACGYDQTCLDKYRIKIEDVPADADLIAMADKFLAAHSVNLDHYGTGIVDNYWRENYEQTVDKTNFYISEYATVVYPLLIDGQPVRDQSGNYAGLRVTINLLRKAASGLSGLTPYRYESSQYDLETSADTIIKLAENGGWNGNYYYAQSDNLQTVELGTPEKSYVQILRYNNGHNEELLVPALIFPVTSTPKGVNYYGQKYIAVPLVKEMISELGQQPVPVLYRMMESTGGTSGSSSGSAGEGSAPASGSGEAQTGTMESVPTVSPEPTGVMMR